ncbi:translocation/assembly module TamB domain-containing protein [Rhizorhabdus phycosphaerae]|uniref:translocation/assembly module TamB domain-containing protein n=1 Tax=Rhizorhabdus phycosphaerae TaxID=2711156 RepID=UPI0013EC20AA|nr:translocation/assembly module TamB domain-containing protein [Rhizorhabdus phycosphaerae]
MADIDTSLAPAGNRSGASRPLWQRIALWTAGTIAGLVLLVLLAIAALDTSPGRRFLADRLAGFETASGLRLTAGRIDGSLYGRMTLSKVQLRDTRGVFLSADRLILDWRPIAYLSSNRIDIRELASPEVRLQRLPSLKPVPSDPDAPLLPDIDVALGRLAIDRLVVAPAITGKAHVVRLSGKVDIADGRAVIAADAAALTGRGLAGGDMLRLRLDAVPASNRLQIDGRLQAPAGGLVDGFAGFGKPLAATLAGAGDWRAWDGTLRATSGQERLADLTVTARSGLFATKGALRPGIIFTGPIAGLTAPQLTVDASARLAERSATIDAKIASDALRATAKGTVDLAGNRFADFHLNAALLKARAMAENLSGDDVLADATLDGPFSAPTIAYAIKAKRLAFGSLGVEGLAAEGKARVDADRISIPLHASARRVTGLNAAVGGLLIDLKADGDLAWSSGRLLSDNLRLRSKTLDATAIIIADPAKGIYTGALKGRVNDYQVDGLGRIALVTDAELVPGREGGFGVRGGFRMTTRRIDNETLRNALGGTAVATGQFGFDGRVARLTRFTVRSPGFQLGNAVGSYDIENGRIAFRASGRSRDYGPLVIDASGTLDRPLVRLRAARPGLGVELRDLVAELRGVPQGYAVKARGATAYGPLTADLLIRQGRGPLAIDITKATVAGVDLKGTIVQTRSGPFDGRLTLAGSGLSGGLQLSAAGGDQRVVADIIASAARIPGDIPIMIGQGSLKGEVVLRPKGPAAQGRFLLADVRQGETIVKRAQGRIDYREGSGTAAIVAQGRSGADFDVAAQARFAPNRIIANAKGRVANVAFRFAEPVRLDREGQDWVLSPARLVVPQGEVRLSGRYGRESRLEARLANFDIGIAQAFAPGLGLGGRASGTLDYASLPGQATPTVNARLDIKRFTRTSAYVVSEPVDLALLAKLDASGGDMRGIVRRGDNVVGRFVTRLAPLGAGATLQERLMQAPLSGGIRYSGPADVPWTLTGIAGQEVSGPIAIAADFGGRLDNPTLTGVARAKTLRYENSSYGTVISNIALDGRFTQSEFLLNSFTGRAGEGTVSATGRIGLAATEGFPIQLKATLAKARLAKSDALGAVASGTLDITNGPGGGLIKGDLRVPEARYRIIRQGAAEVAELTGVRRRGDEPLKPGGDDAGAAPSNWKLDIRIRADNQIFVSGMGLEAEWATDMRVTGTAGDPRVVGRLSVVRGTYSFAGRRFDLDEQGEIRFDGGQLTNPELDLSADTSVEGVTARIVIGGRAMAPQVSFTSTPTLPQDEVLSRLLFGESVTSLSPTQAIQLAAALNSLRGSGGGLNPLGKLRSASGIDRLRVLGADKTAGRGTALAAGQYISNDIYVEVITDARGFTATQLEISLSKTLSLLSQTSSFGGSNASIRYSKDY